MFIFTNGRKYGKMITARQMRNNLIPGAAEEAGMQVSLQGNLAAIVFRQRILRQLRTEEMFYNCISEKG